MQQRLELKTLNGNTERTESLIHEVAQERSSEIQNKNKAQQGNIILRGCSASHCLVYSLFWVHVVQREPPAASRVSKDQRGGLHSDGIVNKSHQETTANPGEHGPDCLIHLLQKGLTPQQLHHHAPNKSSTHFESPWGSEAAGGWSAASFKSCCSDNIPLLADTPTLLKEAAEHTGRRLTNRKASAHLIVKSQIITIGSIKSVFPPPPQDKWRALGKKKDRAECVKGFQEACGNLVLRDGATPEQSQSGEGERPWRLIHQPLTLGKLHQTSGRIF